MLYELAIREDGYHSARDLAEGYRVPEAFVRKVLLDLRRAGVVTAQKGRTGGYRLARAPKEIKLGQLITALEPETPHLVYARQRGGGFVTEQDCPAGPFWKGLEMKFIQAFADSTLADVVSQSRAPSKKRAPTTGKAAPRGRKKARP